MNKKYILDISTSLLSGITIGAILYGLTYSVFDKNNTNNIKHNILSSDYIDKSLAIDQYKNDFVYNPNIKINKNLKKKIKKILEKTAGLDKDPYGRKIGKDNIKLFCSIAIHHGIKQDDIIDDDTFDKLYIDLVKYQIKKYKGIL